MKKLLAVAIVLLTASLAWSQGEVRIHTTPKAPPKDTLDKLSLRTGWHLKMMMDGLRDGYFSLQLIPGPKFTLLVAQTYQGTVIGINADTGDVLWRTMVGRPYEEAQPVGYNNQALFVTRKDYLYVLDRDSGAHQLYTVNAATNLPVYGFGLEGVPSTPVVADEDFVFVSLNNRVIRYVLPDFRAVFLQQERVPQPGKKLLDSPQPIRTWSYNTFGIQLLLTPVVNREMLVLFGAEGTVFTVNKANGETVTRFRTEGALSAQPAFNKSMAYIGSEDYFLYAFDTGTGRVSWRFPGQSPIVQPVYATDRDVFVVPAKTAMYRLDRLTGIPVWKNIDALQFLATNQRFVYALDNQGKFLVIDYERGKELARIDLRDWILPIPNQITDRIYLASNDGQILCLYHGDLTKPLKVKTFEVLKLPKEGEVPPKDKEMPKDKVKDMDKDKDMEKDKDKDLDKKGDKGQAQSRPTDPRLPAAAASLPARRQEFVGLQMPTPWEERRRMRGTGRIYFRLEISLCSAGG